jgi:hypothetical protein
MVFQRNLLLKLISEEKSIIDQAGEGEVRFPLAEVPGSQYYTS